MNKIYDSHDKDFKKNTKLIIDELDFSESPDIFKVEIRDNFAYVSYYCRDLYGKIATDANGELLIGVIKHDFIEVEQQDIIKLGKIVK